MSKGGAPSEQQKQLDALIKNARLVEQQRPRTIHRETVIFQGCQMGWFLVAEGTKVGGYQLNIEDPQENKSYIFQFDQNVFNDISKWVHDAPNVGEDLPTDA